MVAVPAKVINAVDWDYSVLGALLRSSPARFKGTAPDPLDRAHQEPDLRLRGRGLKLTEDAPADLAQRVARGVRDTVRTELNAGPLLWAVDQRLNQCL